MRRLLALAVALGLMLGLRELQSRVDPSALPLAGEPLTLAAIGFVLLAAYTLAELGGALGLPKVTGYILAGLAFGPFASNILNPAVVRDMTMFNTLALGLIATSAGLELDGRAIARSWRTLAATVGLKVVLLPPLVGGTFYVVEGATGLLGLDEPARIGLSLVFSALAVTTSPAIALAVVSETGAKGRLAELTLGLAVVKDVVVVTALAVTMAVTRSLLQPDALLDAHVFLAVGEELGASVLAGLVLAAVLWAYLRFVGAEMLLFVAAMILVVAELSHALHLELLLVFIVAGFVIKNFTRFEHELHHPLELVSLPVFVVFFTNAGAGVDVGATLRIFPLALAIAAARALGFYVAGRFGALLGGERPALQARAWLGYLPQAGVTLGLVGLASRQIPQLAGPILDTGMALVAINLLVGPVTLRLALRALGEIPERGLTEAGEPAEATADAAGIRAAALVVPEVPPRPRAATPELDAHVAAVHAAVQRAIDGVVDGIAAAWSQETDEALERALRSGGDDPAARIEHLMRWAARPESLAFEARAAALREVLHASRATAAELPLLVPVALDEPHRTVRPGDGLVTRVWKRVGPLGELLTGRPRRRLVPVRMATRSALEPRLAGALGEGLALWARTQAHVAFHVRQLARGLRGATDVESGGRELLLRWRTRLRADLSLALHAGLVELIAALDELGTPSRPARSVRFSRVEPRIAARLTELDRHASGWTQRLAAAHGSLRLDLHVERLELRMRAALDEGFVQPLQQLLDAIEPEVIATRDRLLETRDGLDTGAPLDNEALDTIAAATRRAFPQAAHVRIKQLRAEFRERVSPHDVAVDLRRLVAAMPSTLEIVGAGTPPRLAADPWQVNVQPLDLRRIAEQALVLELLPDVDEQVRAANAWVNGLNAQVREHVDVATYALDLVRRGHLRPGDDARALVRDGLERAARRIEELHAAFATTRAHTAERIRDGLAAALETLRARTEGRTPEGGPSSEPWAERALRWVAGMIGSLGAWSETARDGLERALQRAREVHGEGVEPGERGRLDAAELRARLRAHVDREGTAESRGLSPIVERVYTLEPLHDRRLFAARRSSLRALLREERAWIAGGDGAVLVVGRGGAGRSSILNVAQLELAARRVVFIGEEIDPSPSLLATIAAELRTTADPVQLRIALASTPTTIVIDDLERWFAPDPSGRAEFEATLDFVVQTRREAFWVAAIEADALALWDPLVAVRQAFSAQVRLEPLPADALARVVEARARVGGLQIAYPQPRRGVAAWFAPWLAGGAKDRARREYFRRLLAATRGNLREAILGWYGDLRPAGDDGLAPAGSVGWTVPRVLDQLHPHALAMVVQMIRLRTFRHDQLAQALGLSRDETARHLAFLERAGLIEARPGATRSDGTELRVAPAVAPIVTEALRQAGALPPMRGLP